MELILPTIDHKQAAWDYRQEHIDCEETHIHGSGGLIHAEDYESWLGKITNMRTAIQTEWVNGSTYFAFIDNRIVGTIQVRHTLNDYLLKYGGHIGYGVRPSERRKGYASQMLVLALDKYRELGIDKALVTCDKNNIGSAKTILKNGGIFENEYAEENGNIVTIHQRYWITVFCKKFNTIAITN
ncbi:MAG: GNAT family N-acetyltransferase [Oscillospiraceae bacterium]|nr:GNAT family N-acetyltransferase [Oscillospiraceae bacterium]